jgi:protein SCO1/2
MNIRVAFIATLALAGSSFAAPSEFSEVRFEQRIGATLPLSTSFTDTSGASRQLREFFREKPVVLWFGYARCPQLCAVVADGTNDVLRRLEQTVGRDFRVVTISVDPLETQAEAKATETLAVRRYGRTGAAGGWNYLTGEKDAVAAVAAAAGFHFQYDPRSKQYAHPSGFIVVTPTGAVSRYFLGVDFDAKEVAAALRRASEGRLGTPIENLLLRCFRGEAIGGRYGTLIWRTLGASVFLTVIVVAGGVGWMLRQERRARGGGERGSAP